MIDEVGGRWGRVIGVKRDSTESDCGILEVGIAVDAGLRWAAADFTQVIESARRRLDLSPLAAAALGRGLTGAALLLRLYHKTTMKLLLDIRGDGPLGRILAEVDSDGRLRGTVQKPKTDLPATDDGKLAVGRGVGAGTLRVRREFSEGSYESEVELVTGEIGDDLAHFLTQSEQTRAAVLLGVLATPEGVSGAGGAIIEALPDAEEEALGRVEENLSKVSKVSRLIAQSGTAGLMDPVLEGLDGRVLESREFCYRCRCTRERIARHLAALPAFERRTLGQEDGVISAECVFCGDQYRFAPSEL